MNAPPPSATRSEQRMKFAQINAKISFYRNGSANQNYRA